MTSFWCFYCEFWTYFTPFSVFIVDFEQVTVSCAVGLEGLKFWFNDGENRVQEPPDFKSKPKYYSYTLKGSLDIIHTVNLASF